MKVKERTDTYPDKTVVIQPISAWKSTRDSGLCDYFTDDELSQASARNGFIKRGWVSTCGVVDMYVDYSETTEIVISNIGYVMEFKS